MDEFEKQVQTLLLVFELLHIASQTDQYFK